MNRNLRHLAPIVYALAVAGAFMINGRVGVIVTIVGALLVGMVYSLGRGGQDGGRQRNRNRNRDRNR